MGVDGDPTLIPDTLLLKSGRWPRRLDEVLLGSKLSREKQLPVNSTIRLNGRDFTVVGIGRLRGFGFGSDGLAYLDYRAFLDRAEVGDVVSIIAVDTAQPALLREVLPEIGSLAAFSPQELEQQAEEVNASQIQLMWILIVLTLAIAALFVANMLGRSVSERRLEFATLRAIGIPARTVVLAVTAEAALVCVAASLVGFLLSLALGYGLNVYFAPTINIESIYVADPLLFGVVFLLALGLGVVSAIQPARQATRVDPVDVLREA
jgi:putative ABC transport system permease protein